MNGCGNGGGENLKKTVPKGDHDVNMGEIGLYI